MGRKTAGKNYGKEKPEKINFGEILDRWEKTKSRAELEARLKEKESHRPAARNINFKKIPIDASLDLHGLTLSETEKNLEIFVNKARRMGWKKILIIPGKGIHSKKPPVLKTAVMDFIRRSPYLGTHGTLSPAEGGSGAVWVIIKQ